MKVLNLMIVVLLLITGSCSFRGDSGSVLLEKGWKFKTGDDVTYANPSYNDSAWTDINAGKSWEDQGFDGHDGFAWYRLHITLPSSLKDQGAFRDSLRFLLGNIDDYDQVFLNGSLIGENTRNIPSGVKPGNEFTKEASVWNITRRYVLASSDQRIKWDQENILAVRCFDQGGPGGIFGSVFMASVPGLEDYVHVDFSNAAFILEGDSTVIRKFNIINTSLKKEFQGTLEICASDDRGIRLFSEKSGITLTPGLNLEKMISFKRAHHLQATLSITFTEKATGEKLMQEVGIPYIQTPKVKPEPSINGARVYGVRPYSLCLFKVAATGEPPLRYSATNLPEGLSLNPETGLITGVLKKRGEHVVKLHVENQLGFDEKNLKIIVGDLISLTPPMGWNSWNCWGLSVSDRKVRQSALALKTSGLIDHGWTYINIDDGWQDQHDKTGNIIPNAKFPDMKALCEHVHSLGLKIGIYSSPGPKTCGGYEGSYTFEEKDALTYAAWGFDYLKYDWCSYGQIAPKPTPEELKRPYREMKHAIRKVNRDIHYSLCQYGMGKVWEWGAGVDGNSWRTTGDIEDTWESMTKIGFSQGPCSPFAAPGRWNDPDMLVVGWVGWGPALHYTRLTPDEQYTHITLWSLLASPLLIGCDLDQLDPFTINLLANDEVIAVNQDPAGKQASQIRVGEQYEIWARELEDGTIAVGLFNKSDKTSWVPVNLNDLKTEGTMILRDLWQQRDLGKVKVHFEMKVPPHGARMIRLTKVQPA